MLDHSRTELQQLLGRHVVLGVIGAPSADHEVGFRLVAALINGGEHREALFAFAFARGGISVVVGADQLLGESFPGPVVAAL